MREGLGGRRFRRRRGERRQSVGRDGEGEEEEEVEEKEMKSGIVWVEQAVMIGGKEAERGLAREDIQESIEWYKYNKRDIELDIQDRMDEESLL